MLEFSPLESNASFQRVALVLYYCITKSSSTQAYTLIYPYLPGFYVLPGSAARLLLESPVWFRVDVGWASLT